jgi:hypothetical protein
MNKGEDSRHDIIKVVFTLAYKLLERYFETIDISSLPLNHKL